LIGWLFSDRNDDRRKKEIVLLITPRILSNIKPPDAVFTSFPSGIDDTQGSSNKTGRQSAYEPAATAPIQTPDEAQKDRARNDKSFADSVTMQPIDEMADPANIPVRPQ
jgi:general secretion pathway protein D